MEAEWPLPRILEENKTASCELHEGSPWLEREGRREKKVPRLHFPEGNVPPGGHQPSSAQVTPGEAAGASCAGKVGAPSAH